MAYVALYRAYRPQNFNEVSGQEQIVKTLKNAIKARKVAHAYLFAGPRGTGKTTIAKIVAKAVNCPNEVDGNPCCNCDICNGIAKGMIPDVVEIDAASNNGVDEIREIRDKIKYLPSEGKFKVYIIDEVHMLSTGAFNALLKTLEEPPAHAIFILATTEVHKIPATILSRCQRFDFRGISTEDINERIKFIANEEKIDISPEAVNIIAECAEGGMRDALSLFDEAISYSGNKVTADDVYQVSGSVNFENIIELTNAIYEKNSAKTLESLETIINMGKEIPKLCNDLISFYRDILIFKNNPKNDKTIYTKEEFKSLAVKLSNNRIYFYLNALNEAQNNMKYTYQKRTFIELALVKMSDYNEQTSIDHIDLIKSLERKVNDLEAKVRQLSFAKPVSGTVVETPIVVEPERNDSFQYITTDMVEEVLNNGNASIRKNLLANWDILGSQTTNKAVCIMLQGGTIKAASNKSFIITFDQSSLCDKMMRVESIEKVLKVMSKVFGVEFESYLAIPDNTWSLIQEDYMAKYKAGNKTPKLDKIDINVRIYKEKESKVKSELELQASELFGNLVEIEE